MRALRITANPRRLLALSLLAFAAWFILLAAVLFVEHGRVGRAVFSSRASTVVYLGAQGLLTVVAIGLGVLTLIYGTIGGRLLVILPLAIWVIYGLMFIAGPG
jgi:hypothetical protein